MIQNTAKVWNQESFLRSLHVLSYSRNSPHFIEPEGSLPHLQVPATCPYPEPQQSIPCSTPHFYKIHFNILPSKPESSKWSLSLGSHHQKYVCTSPVSHSCHMSRPSHSSRFDHPKNIGWGVQIIKFLILPLWNTLIETVLQVLKFHAACFNLQEISQETQNTSVANNENIRVVWLSKS